MITWQEYEKLVVKQLNRKIGEKDNPDQNKSISAPIDESQFIVAGPGSGKTTVMVLKILKFIFVDDINPGSILATTFTRKAAAELRSRILSWGDQIRQSLLEDPEYVDIELDLRRLDFNQIITGTLDSISEDVLRNHREPGTPPPVVIEDFVANALMLRVGLFQEEKHHNEDLNEYLIELHGGKFGFNIAEMSRLLLEIKDRMYYDQIDWTRFVEDNCHPGAIVASKAIAHYIHELQEKMIFDFALLEADFLDKLKERKLEGFLHELKILLVDEYQDTNLLQEQIYFQLAEAAIINGGSLTVVGDDDQSLYRFRGATVDLFTNFQDRVKNQLGLESELFQLEPHVIYLSQNYRSTQNIVNFCNHFALMDDDFQIARVKNKPQIETARNPPFTDFPILGMFRDDIEILANDLANFIQKVVYGDGYSFKYNNQDFLIKADQDEGSPTDLSILLSSPLEISSFKKKKLPFYLRENLKKLNPEIPIFNPRGQNLERIWEAKVLCGLILECIDPQSEIQISLEKLPKIATDRFIIWRETAREYIETNPEPTNPFSLSEFVDAWQQRKPQGRKTWKKNIPILDLAYKLVTWIPQMQNDVEGLVYLEAITRTISQTALFSIFDGEVIFDNTIIELENSDITDLEHLSISEALWNIFVPLASGVIKVDEALLDTLPDNRINVMSIHQSKGLEFPLVIVDVGSDFRTNHRANAFKRFPETGGKTCKLEDEIRVFSSLEHLDRSGRDRAFDDLIRQYFVAFSRPQDILLLVGINRAIDGYDTKHDHHNILNVATGWTRDGKCKGLGNITYMV